jgi:cobalamin biosynthesis protein CobW
MAAKIPVTVITGFLGSGKTTLIRHLLTHNQNRRIAVLVNEFGELGIDGELLRSCGVCPEGETAAAVAVDEPTIVELNNGCLCCTVQEEFLPTMVELLKRRDQLDSILIETSGLALPKPLINAFRWPEIRNAATVDGVVTVVDCDAIARGQLAPDLEALEAQRNADESLDHETPLQELFEDQLACADLVILNKTDCIDQAQLEAVEAFVAQELPRAVKMIPSQRGQLDANLLLGFNAAVEENLGDRPSHHDGEHDHDHDDQIESVHLELTGAFEPTQLLQHLQSLTETTELYRIKGFINVPNKPMRMVVQGVGQRFDSFYDRPWRADEVRRNQLVFIGEQLDCQQIRQGLETLLSSL